MATTNVEFIFDDSKRSEINPWGITNLVRRSEIPQIFIDECRALANEVAGKPFNHMMPQVRIWPSVHDQMMEIGFDPGVESMKDTKRLLRLWGFDDMIIDKRDV